MLAASAGCTQEDAAPAEQGAAGARDVVGYYVYSDPTRGAFSLALLEQNRFLLVIEDPPPGVPGGSVG